MKKVTLTILSALVALCSWGQVTETQRLLELSKFYKNYMFRNDPSKDELMAIRSGVPENLTTTTEFIVQTVTTKSKLLSPVYLARPDDKVLKQVYIIRALHHNMLEETQLDNNRLTDSLNNKNIPVAELVDAYYGMLFTAVGNKNQPVSLSKTDLRLKDYNLKDDTEKGILVLRALGFCGTTIWGYMNIVKPPNTKKALGEIKKFPKIEGRPYYQYTDFYFHDFEMNIIKDKGIQSYKGYYLDKFYETLLSHLICLSKEGASDNDKNDLLLGSILKDRNLYKYTKYKSTLEDIFKEQKRD